MFCIPAAEHAQNWSKTGKKLGVAADNAFALQKRIHAKKTYRSVVAIF